MKKRFKRVLLMGMSIILFNSCNQDDSSNDNSNIVSSSVTPSIVSQKTTSVDLITGTVLDSNGNPISNTLVTVGNTLLSSNENGYFEIEEIDLPEGLAVVNIEKSGYFSGSRSFTPSEKGNDVEITLIEKKLTTSFNASQGGIITLDSGDIITFPAFSVKKEATNKLYSGIVNVYAQPINIENEEHLNQMPGDLVGVKSNGDENGMLYSYGMLYVELESNSGEKLNILGGETVNIKHPIPSSMLAEAPSEIPFWYFDESAGYWKTYDNSSFRKGNYYEVEVPHFTKLNWDDWKKSCWISGIIAIITGGDCNTCGDTNDTMKDTDEDGINDNMDNCPNTYNPSQEDSDENGIGDACDDDIILPKSLPVSGAYVKIHLDSPTGKIIAKAKTNSAGEFKVKVPREYTNKYYVEVVNQPNKKARKETLSEFKLTEQTWIETLDLGEIIVKHPEDNFAKSIGVVNSCEFENNINQEINITYRNNHKRKTTTNGSGFYGIVYCTSNNLYSTLKEKVNFGSTTVTNTYTNNIKTHRVDFGSCPPEEDKPGNGGEDTDQNYFNTTIDGKTSKFTFNLANKKASYKGGVYLQASESQETLDDKSQGIYILLPDFYGKGTYGASVIVINNVGEITSVQERTPSIQVIIEDFDGTTIKGSGSGRFDSNQKNIEFEFEIPYQEE